MLIGTKCDNTRNWAVSYEEASFYAVKNGFSYVETSAKSGFNIHEVTQLIKLIIVDIRTLSEAFVSLNQIWNDKSILQ